MSASHHSIPLRKMLWVAYLALALVFVQGVRLHLHVYTHESTAMDHAHQEQVHSSYDAGGEHADETAQIDLASQSILKKLSLGSLIVALLATMILFLSLSLSQHVARRPDRLRLFTPWRGCQPPPLRAPPSF